MTPAPLQAEGGGLGVVILGEAFYPREAPVLEWRERGLGDAAAFFEADAGMCQDRHTSRRADERSDSCRWWKCGPAMVELRANPLEEILRAATYPAIQQEVQRFEAPSRAVVGVRGVVFPGDRVATRNQLLDVIVIYGL